MRQALEDRIQKARVSEVGQPRARSSRAGPFHTHIAQRVQVVTSVVTSRAHPTSMLMRFCDHGRSGVFKRGDVAVQNDDVSQQVDVNKRAIGSSGSNEAHAPFFHRCCTADEAFHTVIRRRWLSLSLLIQPRLKGGSRMLLPHARANGRDGRRRARSRLRCRTRINLYRFLSLEANV
jgi:hypothetical protein